MPPPEETPVLRGGPLKCPVPLAYATGQGLSSETLRLLVCGSMGSVSWMIRTGRVCPLRTGFWVPLAWEALKVNRWRDSRRENSQAVKTL
jgi:hypothetical protein